MKTTVVRTRCSCGVSPGLYYRRLKALPLRCPDSMLRVDCSRRRRSTSLGSPSTVSFTLLWGDRRFITDMSKRPSPSYSGFYASLPGLSLLPFCFNADIVRRHQLRALYSSSSTKVRRQHGHGVPSCILTSHSTMHSRWNAWGQLRSHDVTMVSPFL